MTQFIIAAWSASVVLIFLPVLPVARLIGRRFRSTSDTPAPEPAAASPSGIAVPPVGEADSVVVGAASAPAEPMPRNLRTRAFGLFGTLVLAAIYGIFVVSSIYLLPRLLAQVLDNEHPLAAITSQSMYPELKRGDLVFLEGVGQAADLRVGDILAFENANGFAIHRVVAIDGETITTKGDANRVEDEPIGFEDVIGRALIIRGRIAKIPYFGNVPLLFKQTESQDAQAD